MNLKDLQHRLEALLLQGFFGILKLMPLDAASATGGFLGRMIGPFLKAHRTAKENIDRFMPHLSEAEKKTLLKKMWDNLGRIAGELPHLPTETLMSRIECSGIENLEQNGKPIMFFSGHFGNWELCASIAFIQGFPSTLVYRTANNPYVDKIVTKLRQTRAKDMFPKGPKGAVRMARAIKNKDSIAMLVDQKMNDGIPVPFFGVPAMTAPAIAQIALRYDLPIISAQITRKKGAHFYGKLSTPLVYEKTGDLEKDTLAIMTAINQTLESWIREHPEQWFWVHKRWPNA